MLLNVMLASMSPSIPAPPSPSFTGGADAIPVAGINATILAIFFAASVAYLAVVIQKRHELTTEVIEEANKVNDAGKFFSTAEAGVLQVLKGYSPHDPQDRERIYQEMSRLLSAEGDEPPEERAQELWYRMSVVLGSYPFPTRLRVIQHEGQELVGGEEIPVSLFSLKDVRRWLQDLASFRPNVVWWQMSEGRLTDLFMEFDKRRGGGMFKEAAEALAKQPPKSGSDRDFRGILDMMSVRTVPRSFIQAATQCGLIAQSVEAKLEAVDRYERRLPKKRWVLLGLVLGGLLLGSGVLAPMLVSALSPIVYAWLPAAIYAGVFVWILVWVIKRYGVVS